VHENNGLEQTHSPQALGPDEIYALCRIDEIAVAHDFHSLSRRVMTTAIPRTSQERHLAETGHALRFGCCRPTTPA